MDILLSLPYEGIAAVLLLGVLIALLPQIRRMNRLLKKHEEQRVHDRLKQLEQELEVYMTRSQRRLEIFKKVIDGIDQVVQNVKGIIDQEHADELKFISNEGKKELGHDCYTTSKEAEVISIKQFEEKE